MKADSTKAFRPQVATFEEHVRGGSSRTREKMPAKGARMRKQTGREILRERCSERGDTRESAKEPEEENESKSQSERQ